MGYPAMKDGMDNSGSLPVLDKAAWLERLKEARQRTNPKEPPMSAFYSSITNAITTDTEMMSVPLDDHGFVRGHAIYEGLMLVSGRIFRLNAHLDRMFQGAKVARLPLPFAGDEEANRKRIVQIVSETCIASGHQDGMIRFWLSAGFGNFGFSTKGCETTFYCTVHQWEPLGKQGHKEVTVREVPTKPKMLAEVKSNNYMLNCLMYMDAEERGGHYGIWLKPDGNVAESCGSGVIFVTKDRVLIAPAFSGVLPSRTVQLVLQLAEEVLVKKKGLLSEVRHEDISETDAKQAVEVMMVGGSFMINPVIEWDGQKVGTGEPGEIAKELISLVEEEAKNGTSDHIDLSDVMAKMKVTSNGYPNGHANGHTNGHTNGYTNGYTNGHANGQDAGVTKVFKNGTECRMGNQIVTSEPILKDDLAIAHRLMVAYGLDELQANHISAKLPGWAADDFWCTPGNRMWADIHPEHLVKISQNISTNVLHTAVYQACPDALAVCHAHSPAIEAVSCLEDGFQIFSQGGAAFYERVAYYDWQGVSDDDSEAEDIKKAFQAVPRARALIMHNHGAITVGTSVAEAFVTMYYLNRACATQLAVLSSGAKIKRPPKAVIAHAAEQFETVPGADFGCEWPALKAWVKNAEKGDAPPVLRSNLS